MSEGKAALGLLINAPAFFPFQFPILTGDLIAQRSPSIDVVRYGLDDELLRLRRFARNNILTNPFAPSGG